MRVEVRRQDGVVSETVVMLHGFGGTGRHWDRVVALSDRERYSPLALELAAAEPLTLAGALDLISAAAPRRFILCGYSMGGRIALHAAAAMPERVSRLVLVSGTAGIEDPSERAARLAADELLASELEAGAIEDFVERWRAVALFDGDPAWVHAAIAEDQRRLTPRQHAAVLRAFSAGALEPLWDRLGAIATPTVVLAGERDQRYRETGQRLAALLPEGAYETVAGCGHRIALEAPGAVAAAWGAGDAANGSARSG
jgi:2-succinyl-6-hydroxy-2,4-cyclohexadiene-1-carboxylate synthase